jgi:hypothetical protein
MHRSRLLAIFATGLLPLSLVLTANARPAPAPVAGAGAVTSAATGDSGTAEILAAAAGSHDLAVADLAILNRTRGTLPVTGVALTRAKVLDRSSGKTYGVTLDSAGSSIDYQAARRTESRAYRAEFGTMTAQLVRAIETSSASERVAVSFWLKSHHNSVVSRDQLRADVNARTVARVESRNLDRMADAVRAGNRDFAGTLRARGHRVVATAKYSPAVFAMVSGRRRATVARPAGPVDVLRRRAGGEHPEHRQDDNGRHEGVGQGHHRRGPVGGPRHRQHRGRGVL